MISEVAIAIIGFLGIVIGAIPTYLFMRQRSLAEIDKLKAETDKIKAEAEKIRNELKKTHTSEKVVKYNAVIKLIHYETKYSLHSHDRNYEHSDSSKQQQVTAFDGSNDDDYWTVKSMHHYPEAYKNGEDVHNGDIIRLEHRRTRKNLHSHKNYLSPVSHQQEVTAYGQSGIGDTNDNWTIEMEVGDGELWVEGIKVRLIHHETGAALHSHNGFKLPDYGFYQQKVTCYKERNQDDWWCAAIYKEPSTNIGEM